MLHKCSECLNLYLTSHYGETCDLCGGEQDERLELREVDEVVEWWELAAWAEFGVRAENVRRWRIG